MTQITGTAKNYKFEVLTGSHTVDYPYGRLRCDMTFSVEFNPGKGCRSVMQSVNPKNGRLNKPKKSTYSDFVFMYREESTDHIKFYHWHAYSFESIQTLIELLKENTFEFTHEQSQHLFACVISCIRANAKYSTLKEGVSIEEFMSYTGVAEIIKLYGANANFNEMKNINYQLDKIKENKE